MPYSKTTYSTTVTAANLNNGEAGIETAQAAAEAAATDAASRAVRANLPINVKDSLAGHADVDTTGATNATAGLQSRLDAYNHVYIPHGATVRADTTVTIDAYRTLELAPGATLKRVAAASATTPVVRLTGTNYSRLIGHGTVQSEKASTAGVVHVGPAVQTVVTNIQRWAVDGTLTIQGLSAVGNVGLNLTSSEEAGPTGAGSGSNYLGTVGPIDIRDVGTGVKEGPLCNAHSFGAIRFHNIGQYSYHMAGGASASQATSENSHVGGFTHTKASGNITCIRADGYVQFCEFYGVKAEPDVPGAPGSKYYDLGANVSQCRIIGFGNFETSPQGVDAGTNNWILDENVLKVAGGLVVGEAAAAGLGSTWSEIRRSTDAGAGYALAQNSAGITLVNGLGDLRLRVSGNEHVRLAAGGIGFNGTAPVAKPTVTGSGDPAVASLLTALASMGLITDSTTAGITTKTTSYTLALADAGTILEMNSASAQVFTIPLNSSVAFPIGTTIQLVRIGAGTVTITPTAGVTIPNSVQPAGTSSRTITSQYTAASLYKRGTNEWVLTGSLT